MKKFFILGIDSATLDLIEPWANQGKLPNFRKLMKLGSYGTCLSTIHPLTPQAWSSCLTGKNPGKYGLYDFGVRKKGSYKLRLTTSKDRKTPAIWNFINAADMKAGIINVPLTYPPETLDGFMITGMHTPALEKGVYPQNLFYELNSKFPQYKIDVMSHWYDSYDLFLENLHSMAETRMQMGEYLYRKYQPELFFLVLVAVDRVQHALWGQMAHPLKEGFKKEWKYSQAILNSYIQIDGYINRILNFLDDDTILMVISDHGFGSLKKDVYLNRFLIENGFMKIKDKKWNKPFNMGDPFENIDWDRTLAYSYGLFGNIFINLRDREPKGIVNKGKEYEEVMNRLIDSLYQLKDPEDGEKIVTKIFKNKELYHGPYVEDAPDIIIIMRDYSYITRGGYEFLSNSLFSRPKINHSGNHRMNGIAFFYGAGIKKGFKMPDIQIIDLLPTILSIMEIPIPDDIDGRVVHEISKSHH